MAPIFGFLLFAVCTLIVSIVASKRGRSGVLLFVLCVVGGVVVAMLAGAASGGNGTAAGFAAFLVPAAGLMWALSAQSSEQIAVAQGEHGEFRKCPFCAESIRKEAIKCKHCGSEVPAQ